MPTVEEQIRKLINKGIEEIMMYIHKHSYDPLDGDEVDKWATYFEASLNWHNGNTTDEEYTAELESINEA